MKTFLSKYRSDGAGRSSVFISQFLCVVLFFASRGFGAEVLDRIAIVVGNTAITKTEVAHEARIAAFINGEAPDLGPAGKRRAAERLVEQELIRREIGLAHYADSGEI